MGKATGRSSLYIVCAALFPLGFAAFVIGFGCPVWYVYPSSMNLNAGLWQMCFTVVSNCTTFDFANTAWMAGVRGVEIFALVMACLGLTQLVYENACTGFRGRAIGERLAVGGFCLLTGMGGLAGIITYVIKMDIQMTSDAVFGWALALLAAGSGLMVVIGVGFLIHGCFLENRKCKEKDPTRMNGQATHDQNYVLPEYTNRAMTHDDGYDRRQPPKDNLPGYAVYNGLQARPGDRRSLSGPGPSMFDAYPTTANVLPSYPANRPGSDMAVTGFNGPNYSPPQYQKAPQYYSVSDDRLTEPGFDLSEGYRPSRRAASPRPADNPYTARAADNPYSSRPKVGEDQYNRLNRYENPPRPFTRDSYYRGAPF